MSNRLVHRTSRLNLPPLPPKRGGGGPQPPPWPTQGVSFWLSVLVLVLSALLIFGMILWGLRLALIEHRLMARLGADPSEVARAGEPMDGPPPASQRVETTRQVAGGKPVP